MRCPGCGEINEPGFRFCRNCGSALSEREETAATAAISMPPAAPAAPAEVVAPQPETFVTFKLLATKGLLTGRTFTIGPRGLLIGRDPANCQVVLADDEISRTHAWVGFDNEGRVVVRDRNSANGTYVNQVRIQERVLRPTDELEVGTDRRHLFRIERTGGEAVSSPPPAPVTERLPVARPAAPIGGTSIMGAPEAAAIPREAKATGGTVALKLTDLMARPHLELIVDKYAVKTLEVPSEGLSVGRDSGRCQVVMEHPSVSAIHANSRSKTARWS